MKIDGEVMADVSHIAVIICAFTAYTILHMSGHADHSTDTALWTLAAFFGGSYTRSKDSRGTK
jgi:NO-binding membrane sensor protein with MHYT domain